MKKSILPAKRLIVIVGPTATGKSGLAVSLAKKFHGEVISADSRQVYRGLNIGSGKIAKKEMMGIRHHLLDVTNPRQTFTVAHYQHLAHKALENVWKRDKLPIFCGGTGFYIESVVDGLVIPEVKPNPALRKKLRKISAGKLFGMLKKKDPRRAAVIDRYNPVRLIRALEIADALGKVPELKKNPIAAGVLIIGVTKNASELRKAIETRLAKRIKAGMVKEVEQLHQRGVSWKRLEDFGLEYRYVALYLQNKIKKEELVPLLSKKIRDYAKRQMTWFKRDKRIRWISKPSEAFTIAKTFITK